MRHAPPPTLPRRRGREKKSNPLIETVVQSARWKQQPKAAQIVRKSISAAAIATSTPRAELAILLTDDSAIRALNRDWRGLDAPTNVLSFLAPRTNSPVRPRASGDPGQNPQRVALDSRFRGNERRRGRGSNQPAPTILGDIVIAYQTVAREARNEGKPFAHHLAHLAVHGYLHLVGYDHDTDRKARQMEQLEVAILARVGVPDPYARHVGTRHVGT